jgi:hypothetical protein
VDYDPTWLHRFELEANRIKSVLGSRALCVEHVGSISVPDPYWDSSAELATTSKISTTGLAGTFQRE